MELLSSQDVDTTPAFEMALAHALVRQASAGDLPSALRIYQPQQPSVVFGRRDTKLPGFPEAVAAAHAAGFATAIRATGGRAVAYTDQTLVIDHVQREPQAGLTQTGRFEAYGDLLVEVLQVLGVDARLGAVPGEYCPGAHSVNARGQAKLVGTAQRVIRDAWLFSSLVIVGDAEPLQKVLAQVYAALEQPFEPDSVGSVEAEAPGATVDSVRELVMRAYAHRAALTPAPIASSTVSLAHTLVGQHSCS